ncbi:MAG: hypothetical protein ACYCY6_02595 [Minisyncoccota bacterium]
MTSRNLLIGVAILAVIGLIFYFVYRGGDGQDLNPVDQNGTSTASWTTSDDTARGINFMYPEDIDTEYIELLDWPPQVAVIDEPFSCTEAGGTTENAGETSREVINGNEYCVTRVVEGAAGSVYTQYAFAREVDDGRVAIFTFSTRAPQCGNYGDENDEDRIDCEEEMSSFNIGNIVDQMFGTLSLGEPSLDYVKG